MSKTLTLVTAPDTPPLPLLIAVDRAVSELRRGGYVVVAAGDDAILVQAAEAVAPDHLAYLSQIAGATPSLAVTLRRAAVLGLPVAQNATAGVVVISSKAGLDAEAIGVLVQPTASKVVAVPSGIIAVPAGPGSSTDAAVRLTKLARLLPAAVFVPVISANVEEWAHRRRLPLVRTSDILGYDPAAAASLRPVSEAQVPLADAMETRIVAFRPADGGIEHLAIIIGKPDGTTPVLARLHSECFTGDLLGSLRCDCGDQLRGAIAEIAQAGSGVLLYLAQEGRGIGLVNKLRAYQLQDAGFDTLDANNQLGFDDDERVYLPAAAMLRMLGYLRVRLMTNNPRKVEALARHGVEVVERVPHVFPANDHNQFYLHTKATKGGHLF
ncbi:MAG: GTP cyclohydrolase II [Alphaproteobacteria bacterium]|nr:GTP cyclohydrolase II [Alphaproteobacteria bacterium]